MRVRFTAMTLAAAAAVSCTEFGTNPGRAPSADDFALEIAGTGETQSTYTESANGNLTGFVSGGFSAQQGPGRRGGAHWMMGGGLEGGFVGYGFGPGFGMRPIDAASCTFNATSGRVECAAVVRHGLTITRSFAFATASGAVQTAFDSATTDRINTRSSIRGTIAGGFRRGFGHGFRHGFGPGHDSSRARHRLRNDTTTVDNTSDRTVSGLRGTERVVNSVSSGRETTVGTDSTGRVTILRVANDTTSGVRIPVTSSGPRHPVAGTIIRNMQVTITYDGRAPQVATRREVVTFDGSATARVTITEGTTTRTCTLPLPRGRLTCS
jgi:hypothetical protein